MPSSIPLVYQTYIRKREQIPSSVTLADGLEYLSGGGCGLWMWMTLHHGFFVLLRGDWAQLL
jgi:hypothetical protein